MAELPPLQPGRKWVEVDADHRLIYFGLFIDFHRAEGHSEASITAYLGDLRDFFKLCTKPLDEVEFEDIDACTKAWQARGLTPKTISRRHAAVSSLFHCLQRLKVVKGNPVDMASKPKIPKRLPKNIPNERETEAMCAVPGLPGYVCRILYGTGARRAEMASAKVEDYDAEAGTVRIIGKGNKEGYLLLTLKAKKALEAIIIPGSEYLLCFQDGKKRGLPLGKYGIYEEVLKARAAAGVVKNVTPHRLRAACATVMDRHGADIRKIQLKLRHESPATTQRYIDVNLEQQKLAQAQYHPDDQE